MGSIPALPENDIQQLNGGKLSADFPRVFLFKNFNFFYYRCTFSRKYTAMQNIYLRWPTVQQVSGLSRVTIWRMERDDKFPRRRQLSANSVGWLQSEIETWVNSREQVFAEANGVRA
jgi:prophage regulatory protein